MTPASSYDTCGRARAKHRSHHRPVDQAREVIYVPDPAGAEHHDEAIRAEAARRLTAQIPPLPITAGVPTFDPARRAALPTSQRPWRRTDLLDDLVDVGGGYHRHRPGGLLRIPPDWRNSRRAGGTSSRSVHPAPSRHQQRVRDSFGRTTYRRCARPNSTSSERTTPAEAGALLEQARMTIAAGVQHPAH